MLADLSRLLELGERDDLVADRDARVHRVREVGDVTAGRLLKEHPLLRQRVRGDHEHVARRLPDADALALAHEALLDDAPALDDADAHDLRLREAAGALGWSRRWT